MDNAIIDVALGLVLLYAILSLFLTTIVEAFFGTIGNRRGKCLRVAIESAFGATKADDDLTRSLVDAFYQQPLLLSLYMGRRDPADIPPDVFVQGFLNVVSREALGKDYPAAREASPGEFVARIASRTTTNLAKPTEILQTLLSGTESDWAAFEAKVMGWFTHITNRNIGWYKRSLQRRSFVLALLIAFALNADSLFIADSLWSNAALRDSVARLAERVDAVRKQESEGEAKSGEIRPLRRPTAEVSKENRERVRIQLNDVVTKINNALKGDPSLAAFCHANYATDSSPAEGNGKKNSKAGTSSCRGKTLGLINDEVVRVGAKLLAMDSAQSPASETQVSTQLREAHDTLRTNVKYPLEDPYLKERDKGKALQAAIPPLDEALRLINAELAVRVPLEMTYVVDARCHSYARSPTAPGAEKTEFGAEEAKRYQECQRLHLAARQGELGLPLGWSEETRRLQLMPGDSMWQKPQVFAGWLMTAIALMLGAPFWFDLLGKVVQLRASGKRTEDQDTAAKTAAPVDATGLTGALPGTPGDAPGSAYFADALTDAERKLTRDEIQLLQQALEVTPASGRLDNNTRSRIAKWSADNGYGGGGTLTETMVQSILKRAAQPVSTSPQPTTAELQSAACPDALRVGDQGDLVRRMKGLLFARGITEGVELDGSFDEATAKAVKKFQAQNRLAQDGEVGWDTWLRLALSPDDLPPALRTPAWMMRAFGEIDQAEIRGSGSNPRIEAYLRTCDLPDAAINDETPWCAAFVTWVMQEAGYDVSLPAGGGTGSRKGIALAKEWSKWGKDCPAGYGAIAILSSGSNYHVGFLVRESNDHYILLGGNQSDRVDITRFPRNTHELFSVRTPAGEQLPAPSDTLQGSGGVDDADQENTFIARRNAALRPGLLADDVLAPPLARGTADFGSVRRLQRLLNGVVPPVTGAPLSEDGKFGPTTEAALRDFQARHGLPTSGVVDAQTWAALDPSQMTVGGVAAPAGQSRWLTDADYDALARQVGLEKALLIAVRQVESSGSGFLPSGDPRILFEGHIFYRELTKAGVSDLDAKIGAASTIVYRKWTRQFYKGGQAEHERLSTAIAFATRTCGKSAAEAEELAWKSASWGLFQIMGFNYAACGFTAVHDFHAAMCASEKRHLEAFCAFVKTNSKMFAALKDKDWPTFARLYNGSGYQQNRYDQKLRDAYERAL